jgi:membrane protease YdiL (CAAX protease family)
MRESMWTGVRIQIFLFGIMMFSYFIHDDLPIRLLAIVCLFGIAWLMVVEKNLGQKLLGTIDSRRSMFIWTIITTSGAFLLAAYSRNEASLSLLPRNLLHFTPVAVCIGILEEIMFRGWLFSHLSKWKPWIAVLATATAHAGYKSVLFLSPYLPYEVNSWDLFLVTFETGIFLGLTRLFSGSVWPALIAHAVFDLLIYGDQPIPWWIF